MSDIELSVDGLRGMIDRHSALRDDLTDTGQGIQALARIASPMNDPATTAYITAACETGRRHNESVSRIEEELRTRIAELKASLDQSARTEQDNVQRMAG
ncbi:hypothetical protein [Lentzea sp. NBRC 105346]|uniref:hypothetical protein n=1 Tax=Lentzea sp. NBRC 105346 TaxID=3032205 RepID=UPI0025528B3F|nr:hypothetical protein [Lentzea sp. NBRC 105346]